MSNIEIIKLSVRISSQVAGFRRAGIAHPKEPVTYPAEQFTAEQLEALRAEPVLTVELIEQPSDNDAGDEQPPASPDMNPGAERAEGLNGDAAAGAGSPAPAAAAAHSTTDAQTMKSTAGNDTAPAGGQAAGTAPIVSAKQEGPEAPANGPAPKAAKAKAKEKAAAKKAPAKAGK